MVPAVTFRGAMRPQQGGSDGRCMLDVRHLVELRCGRQQVAGIWCDVWVAQGAAYVQGHLAQDAASELRTAGHTVRVRPVIV